MVAAPALEGINQYLPLSLAKGIYVMELVEDIRHEGGSIVTERLVEIDVEDLRVAQELLQASTIKETVALALKEVIAVQARRQHIELLRTGYMELMADKQERRRAWGQ